LARVHRGSRREDVLYVVGAFVFVVLVMLAINVAIYWDFG
jgi:hypothetical protein